ncbi:tRNA synthetases class II-domain-containing protein [Xylariomycetidae sp. FL2044]|nr:tRNA synthetases class II-domain-containing protein [Xylariomycetidae sp. FL2044]
MVRLPITTTLPRIASRCLLAAKGRLSSTQQTQIVRRSLHNERLDDNNSTDPGIVQDQDPRWDTFKSYFSLPHATTQSAFEHGVDVTVHGFLAKRRDKSANLSFCDLTATTTSLDQPLQIVSAWQEEGSLQHTAHQLLRSAPAHSPVCVVGTLQKRDEDASSAVRHQKSSSPPRPSTTKWDIKLRSIQLLNTFPKDIIVSRDAVWPPKSRHLQLRFDPLLRERLRLRQLLTSRINKLLRSHRFLEVETPLLFKSTPEGAREFLVPTRREGYAYALPQSPQQYKQILMAGGIARYFQFAKCFRDEDHRADRQPEFTQLDLEMAFETSQGVRLEVEKIIKSIFQFLEEFYVPYDINGTRHPIRSMSSDKSKTYRKGQEDKSTDGHESATPAGSRGYKFGKPRFPRMSYDYVMSAFGSDKPDLRMRQPYVSHICRIDGFLAPDFISMITDLENPIVDACKFRLGELSPSESGQFIRDFMDTLPSSPLKLSPGSSPGVFVFDSSKPLQGLSALGHEAAGQLGALQTEHWPACEDGDIIIVQARKNAPLQGGSTDMGRLRTAIYETAIAKGHLPRDHSFKFLWVYDFPLFTPQGDDPGQGGAAGFSATHHPFTAPKNPKDFDLLKTDPLKARADHYDLVVNGVELGGGSRRIHIAEVQEYVMRDILKMTDQGISQFSHLIEALRAGCPPHAGFAFGFDRLMAVICGVPSVKDVIAFPKSNKGEDLLVGSPTKTTPEQQAAYHLSRTGQ